MVNKIAELWGWGRIVFSIGFLAGGWILYPWRQALTRTIIFIIMNLVVDAIILLYNFPQEPKP